MILMVILDNNGYNDGYKMFTDGLPLFGITSNGLPLF